MKYSVEVLKSVYCSSSGHYSCKVIIRSEGARDVRTVDLHGLRIMWRDKPFTYNGYPDYVRREIADQMKTMYDNDGFIVYEYDRDGNKRVENLHYHTPQHLEFTINTNLREYGSEDHWR